MAVLNPVHLLEQAELLLKSRHSGGLVRQADRRRAISSAYYAVFHFILTAAADQFVGNKERRSAQYSLVYRSIDHNDLKNICDIASNRKLSDKYKQYVPEEGFGPNIVEFATLALELRSKRHSADYDPSHWVKVADANSAILAARSAMLRFGKATSARRKSFLTLLVFKPRN